MLCTMYLRTTVSESFTPQTFLFLRSSMLIFTVHIFQTVLIHSVSKVVYWTLRQATENRKRLKVFITTCALDQSG